MTPSDSTVNAPDFRLQGTDGVRREVRPASEFSGLSPVEVFLKHGFLTDAFLELYAYAHVSSLIAAGAMQAEDGFVVGWDPRDPQANFTEAVVRGVRKAGASALVLGVVPTPLVPMMAMHRNAGGGFMVTASHNPKDQNGIKTFCAHRGMKFLPANDTALTRTILKADWDRIQNMPLAGNRIDAREAALDLFRGFSLLEHNSWIDADLLPALKQITLVVDPANGSLSGIAAEVFKRCGFGRVIEVNGKLNGDVNLHSGVADLEGLSAITPEMIEKGTGAFRRHKAVLKLFELGRKSKDALQKVSRRVAGAVFDADGDRFFRLEYDPFHDSLLVLSGDETAFLQAQYLMALDPKAYKNALYINTVESDLNAAVAAKHLGFKVKLTAVGDKWILLKTAFLIAEAKLAHLKKNAAGKLPSRLSSQWEKVQKQEAFSVEAFAAMETAIDSKTQSQPAWDPFAGKTGRLKFAVGSEETGHNITLGRMQTENGEAVPVFFGNGLKSALNTFAATETLFAGKRTPRYYSSIHRPFKPGFKATLYVYYIDKALFGRDSGLWKRVRQTILKYGKDAGFKGTVQAFQEDTDMLYLNLRESLGGDPAAVFVRNSGTENKISVNLRGAKKQAKKLNAIGEAVLRLLLAQMKDTHDRFYKLELDVLSQVASGPVAENKLKVDKNLRTRLLAEMAKQGLLRLTQEGYRLSPRGKWYIASDRNPD